MAETDIDPEDRQAANELPCVNLLESPATDMTITGLLSAADSDFSGSSIYSLIHQLPDGEFRHKLTDLLARCLNDRAHYESLYTKAEFDANDAKERVKKLEMELDDLRSATALMVAGQDDAFSNLKRRYDEEIASLQSISQQEVAEIQAASHTALEEERTRWAGERNALLAHLHAQQNHHLPDRPRFTSPSQSDRSGAQTLTTHALEMVEKLTRRVKGLTSGEVNAANNGVSSDIGIDPMPSGCSDLALDPGKETYVERYEKEIARLRGMLEDFFIKNETGLHDEAEEFGVRNQAIVSSDCSSTHNQPISHLKSNNTKVTRDANDAVSNTIAPITEFCLAHLHSTPRLDHHRSSNNCAMCNNYEQLLQTLQAEKLQNDKKLNSLFEELTAKSSECTLALKHNSELEKQLRVCTVEHTKRIGQLEAALTRLSQRMDGLLGNFKSHRQLTENELSRLADERKATIANFQLLQSHYDALLDRRSKAAHELSEQPIHLPGDKTELELLALKLYEENLSIRAAREHLDERWKSDSQVLRQQLSTLHQEKTDRERSLQRDIEELNARLASLSDILQQRDQEITAREKLQQEVTQLTAELTETRKKLTISETESAEARAEAATLQQRLVCLQTDLDNVESVQADFVRLSQNLQIQLERLRQQNHEVRWVDPDDVSACSACDTVFSPGSAPATQKVNCRHCGKVYCPNCLQNTVPSGPIGRPARVCDVCHTLLNKHVAPYFSTGLIRDHPAGTQSINKSPGDSMCDTHLHSPKQTSYTNQPAGKFSTDA